LGGPVRDFDAGAEEEEGLSLARPDSNVAAEAAAAPPGPPRGGAAAVRVAPAPAPAGTGTRPPRGAPLPGGPPSTALVMQQVDAGDDDHDSEAPPSGTAVIHLPSASDDDIVCPGRFCWPINACMRVVRLSPRSRKFIVRWYLYIERDMVPLALTGAFVAVMWSVSVGSAAVLLANPAFSLWIRVINLSGALFASVVWPIAAIVFGWQFGPRSDVHDHIGVGYALMIPRCVLQGAAAAVTSQPLR
jgi:hypothetical protein